MAQHPIQNRVGMVFIPVSNLDRAIDWYSRLLDLPIGEPSHQGTIYGLKMQGETGVILDSTKPVVHNSSQPLLFFWCDDIVATWHFLQSIQVEIIGEIADIGSVSTLIFKDLDQNLLMVCQSNGER